MLFKSKVLATIICLLTLSSCATLANNVVTPVKSIFQTRSLGAAIDDVAIRNAIEAKMATTNISMFNKVYVDVHRGRVLLTGRVSEPEHKNLAAEIASRTEDVLEVVNDVLVTEDINNPANYIADSMLTTQAKSLISTTLGFSSINYTIRTQRGIVYIIGDASSSEELAQAVEAIRGLEGVREVRTYAKVARVSN